MVPYGVDPSKRPGQTHRQYLKKGTGYSYPLGNFLKGEPEWKAELVEELEAEFADIRKQLGLLGKICDAVQAYRKTLQS
jgi:hypothetical protein